MKKLIWLAVLGVIFFIGGQWIGLSVSDKAGNSLTNEPIENLVTEAPQDGSASVIPSAVQKIEEKSGAKKTGSGGTNP